MEEKVRAKMIVIGAQDMKKDFIEDFQKVQKGLNRVKNGGNRG